MPKVLLKLNLIFLLTLLFTTTVNAQTLLDKKLEDFANLSAVKTQLTSKITECGLNKGCPASDYYSIYKNFLLLKINAFDSFFQHFVQNFIASSNLPENKKQELTALQSSYAPVISQLKTDLNAITTTEDLVKYEEKVNAQFVSGVSSLKPIIGDINVTQTQALVNQINISLVNLEANAKKAEEAGNSVLFVQTYLNDAKKDFVEASSLLEQAKQDFEVARQNQSNNTSVLSGYEKLSRATTFLVDVVNTLKKVSTTLAQLYGSKSWQLVEN